MLGNHRLIDPSGPWDRVDVSAAINEISPFSQVQINEEGAYDLMGEISIRIVDSVAKFTTIDGNTTYRGKSVSLNLTEWTNFVDGGADIDSIRSIKRVRQLKGGCPNRNKRVITIR